MTVIAHLLASGPGWHVSDVICAAGKGTPPFEERHDSVCIAAVMSGSFSYRSEHGAAMMTPGAILLGNADSCFECGHDHSADDRCLSFHFTPELFERLVSSVPGAFRTRFRAVQVPPLPALTPLFARGQAARDRRDQMELEELAIDLAGAVVSAAADGTRSAEAPSHRDQKRVAEAVRWIELNSDQPASLDRMATATATSPYHFLRVFRGLTGMAPYQYLLHRRLMTAAARLRSTDEPISTIALEAGFGDLSTFNRRFRKVMGVTPGGFRRGTFCA